MRLYFLKTGTKVNYLLSLLLLGAVSHAHAAGVTAFAHLAQIVDFLNKNTGTAILLTMIIFIVKLAWDAKAEWNALGSNVTTSNTDVYKMKEYIRKLQTDASKLKIDISELQEYISNIKDNVHKIISVLFSKERPILHNSPLRITSTGKKIAMNIGADKLLTKHWEYLKSKVDATKPRGAYDIEMTSVEVAEEMDVVLSDEDKDIIKAEAFDRGIPYEEILSIIGVMLRDKLLEEHATVKIRSNPKESKAYYSRGNTRRRLGKFQDAISDYDEAIRLNLEYLEAYNNRGNTKNKLGEFQDAISDCDEAIRLSPELSVAYINRGVAKNKLGDKKGALADFTKAKELSLELDTPDLQSDL